MDNSIKLNNGVEMPIIGFGVYQAQSGTETVNAVKDALTAGYRHIDTAMIYGNESSVGKGIAQSGVNRKDIFVTTKIWNGDIRNNNVKAAFETSLGEMNMDYIDLYLMHWPAQGYLEAWKGMEKLYASGKVKAIGVSNFQISHLKELMKTAKITPAVNQIEAHPKLRNQEVIDFCHEEGIAVTAWSPLGASKNNLIENSTLIEIAKKYNKTTAQVMLRWNIQRNVIVIPKSVHKDRIISNLNVFDFELSSGDIEKINGLNENKRVGPDPDNFDF
ncbi:MAG: aldo/keto reductase [Suipraeoptans sp.]